MNNHSYHLQYENKIHHTCNPVSLNAFNASLLNFENYALNDLNNANLMNRVDTKYLIPIHLMNNVLEKMSCHYQVLEINKKRIFTYQNTYFDTPEYDLYYDHHNGKLNRYKVRQRHYIDNNSVFLEVKFKNNKNRTIKSRIQSSNHTYNQDRDFLSSISSKLDSLIASQWGKYKRISLANEQDGERLTLDFDLSFESLQEKNSINLSKFFIAELKQNKHNYQSPFSKEMSKLGIRPTKFSKYCIGCCLTNSNLKNNRFKPVLSRIKTFN